MRRILPVTVHLQGPGAMITIYRSHLSPLWTAVLFTLYFFVFLTSEVFLQDCLLALDRPGDLHTFFLGQLACLTAGYLSLALCRRASYGLLRSLAVAAILLPALLFSALALTGSPSSLPAWAAACSYCLGGAGAFLHYSAALCLRHSAVSGRLAGGSIGLAVGIQFLTDTCLDSGQTAMLLALVSLVLAMLLARAPAPAPAAADEAPSSPPSRRTLALATAGTAILSIVVGLNEDIVTRLYATGELDVTSWPRLCYLAGLLLAGFLADIRKRAFMPVITLCVLMLSNMAIFFLNDPRHYQLNLSILYFYSGFYVVYFTVLFLDLAPGTRWPLLWAGMGRLCRSLCVGAFFLCPNGLFGLLGQGCSVVLNSLLLAGVCAIFFWSGQLRDHGSARSAPPVRQDQAIGLFAQKHALTRRETDVLRAVLASSEPLGNIAICLGISERVMQRHLTSIYAKCRVSGRLELVTAFFGQTSP